MPKHFFVYIPAFLMGPDSSFATFAPHMCESAHYVATNMSELSPIMQTFPIIIRERLLICSIPRGLESRLKAYSPTGTTCSCPSIGSSLFAAER